MSFEDLERCARWFTRLVPKAAEIHPWTWCVRDQRARLTMGLEGEECCYCPHYIENGGICDPL